MKNENYVIVGIVVIAIAAFYYFAIKKPTLSVQLMDSSGNLANKGTSSNPVTSADIQAVTQLLKNLLTIKASQPPIKTS